jgi:hypothetical protein
VIKISRNKIDVKLLKKRLQILNSTSRTLRKLSKEKAPKNLTSEQKKEQDKYNKWLISASAKLDELAVKGETLLGSEEKLMQATLPMQELYESFNLEYLKLQRQMQSDNRQFTLMSNIMKVKHDTAKNAINNVR